MFKFKFLLATLLTGVALFAAMGVSLMKAADDPAPEPAKKAKAKPEEPAKAEELVGSPIEYELERTPRDFTELTKLVQERGKKGWRYVGQIAMPAGFANGNPNYVHYMLFAKNNYDLMQPQMGQPLPINPGGGFGSGIGGFGSNIMPRFSGGLSGGQVTPEKK